MLPSQVAQSLGLTLLYCSAVQSFYEETTSALDAKDTLLERTLIRAKVLAPVVILVRHIDVLARGKYSIALLSGLFSDRYVRR
jgi:hypothetical protein